MSDQFEKDIELANAAADFLRSDLGQRITEMAGEEIDRCIAELKTVDPDDAKKVRELQETIRRNETLGPYILEIIHRGEQAKQATAEEY